MPASVIVNGTTYRPGMMLCISYTSDGEPQFAKITNIIVFDSAVKLLVQRWHTTGFCRHYFAFSVSPLSLVQLLDANDLLDHHPYHAIQSFKVTDGTYVSLRYRLF